jgi:hypothetical protein
LFNDDDSVPTMTAKQNRCLLHVRIRDRAIWIVRDYIFLEGYWY